MNSSSDISATPGVELGPRTEDEPRGRRLAVQDVTSLMWLSIMTRPVISYAMSAVTRHSREPTGGH